MKTCFCCVGGGGAGLFILEIEMSIINKDVDKQFSFLCYIIFFLRAATCSGAFNLKSSVGEKEDLAVTLINM